jgi:hypothetical protein
MQHELAIGACATPCPVCSLSLTRSWRSSLSSALHMRDQIQTVAAFAWGRLGRTIFSSASAGALLTLSKAVVGDARLRLPGPQLVRGVSNDVMKDVIPSAEGSGQSWHSCRCSDGVGSHRHVAALRTADSSLSQGLTSLSRRRTPCMQLSALSRCDLVVRLARRRQDGGGGGWG